MTQNEKELLMKDLCARQLYNVKVSYRCGHTHILKSVLNSGMILITDTATNVNTMTDVENVIPYLFPLSSMTEEQKQKSPFESSLLNAFVNGYISLFEDEELNVDDVVRMLDWLNANHFDYRGLINKGLAIDCTNLNIY